MSYVYVGTRNANNESYAINELFVASTEEGVLNQMVPFVTEAVVCFIDDNIDVIENVVDMLYGNEVLVDEFDEKVASLKKLTVEEIVKSLSPRELLTIYGNLYREEERLVVAGYNEDGEQEVVVLSNESNN